VHRRVRVLPQALVVEVGHVVTQLVVAPVEGHTSGAAVRSADAVDDENPSGRRSTVRQTTPSPGKE
jgi:hypothetical protein